MAILSPFVISSLNSASPELSSAGGPVGITIRVNHSTGSLGIMDVWRIKRYVVRMLILLPSVCTEYREAGDGRDIHRPEDQPHCINDRDSSDRHSS